MTQEARDAARERRLDRLATIAAGVAAAIIELEASADPENARRLARKIAPIAQAILQELE